MMRLADTDPVYLELYEALAHFIGRQQLVVRAVIEQGVATQALEQGVAGWHDKTPQTGMWGENWRFMFHGGGCALTHLQTGEPIDWNGPDPHAFGTLAFIRHLKWRLARGHTLTLLGNRMERDGEQAIAALIEDLIVRGVISPDRRLIYEADQTNVSAA
jgi:hypothetical protein